MAFFSLLIASSISTGIINKICDTVNKYGNGIGIEAYKGKTFIGMTWAATLLIVLAGGIWVFDFMQGRKQRVNYVIEGKEGQHKQRVNYVIEGKEGQHSIG